MLRLFFVAAVFLSSAALAVNVTELIAQAGYPVQQFEVETPDGYLLGVQRIPPKTAGAPVVFLQHGLLDCAATWVANPPDESLGFILHDSGFDVYLGNVRGNIYSLKHINLTISDPRFWAFSYDQFTQIDLETMLNFALDNSGANTLSYVGHSQGSLMFFSALTLPSSRAFMGRSIKNAVLLGPVGTVSDARLGILKLIINKNLFNLFGDRSFGLTTAFFERLFPEICKEAILSFACKSIILSMVGWDPKELNRTRVDIYTSFDPAGTSVQNLVHFQQIYKAGHFQMYDYGSPALNIQHYGQPTPPVYNIPGICNSTMPVPRMFLISGGRDADADPTDVAVLEKLLAPCGIKTYVEPTYDHLDFLWAEDAHTKIYPQLIAFLQQQ